MKHITASDSFMITRAKKCLAGDHVKRKWISTGEDSGYISHEPTTRKEDCIFCAHMTTKDLENAKD